MAIYVCSDIHGRYDRYKKLLERLNLSEVDKLYILGDAIDRNGNGGIDILQDLVNRSNVQLILGNHEMFMIDCVSYFISISEKGLKYDYYANAETWFSPNNGGRVTFDNFMKLDVETQSSIFDYLLNCLLIKVVSIGDKLIHLSHACTVDNIEKDTYKLGDVSDKEVFDIVWKTPLRRDRMYAKESRYREDFTYITGHVPIQNFTDKIAFVRYRNIIDIDCGCALGDELENRLGCLCLDTQEEFFID